MGYSYAVTVKKDEKRYGNMKERGQADPGMQEFISLTFTADCVLPPPDAINTIVVAVLDSAVSLIGTLLCPHWFCSCWLCCCLQPVSTKTYRVDTGAGKISVGVGVGGAHTDK